MVKFGLYLPVYGGWIRSSVNEKEETPTYSYIRQVAVEAEKIGIDSLWIPDHLLNPIKGESSASLEAWTVAAAIAEVTKKVTIAHTTLCEAFRYPAVLAKQTVALNGISNGGSGLVSERDGSNVNTRPTDYPSTNMTNV